MSNGLPVIPDGYQVAIKWTGGGVSRTNVLHFGTPSGTSAATLGIELAAKFTADMWQPICSVMTATELEITKLDGVSSAVPRPVALTGSGSGGQLVPATCACIKFSTGLAGKSFRGRVYLGPVSETDQINGEITSNLNICRAAWETFNAALAADGYAHIVVSKKLDTAHGIIAYGVTQALATQRRAQGRLRRV